MSLIVSLVGLFYLIAVATAAAILKLVIHFTRLRLWQRQACLKIRTHRYRYEERREDTDTFAVADTDAQSDTLDSLGCLLCLALRI